MSAIKEDPIADILKKIAPGTPIREGLDSILKAKTGALLLLTDSQVISKDFLIFLVPFKLSKNTSKYKRSDNFETNTSRRSSYRKNTIRTIIT